MAEQITIAELGIDTDALIKQMTETRTSIDSLRKSQKELQAQGKSNTQEFSENELALKKLSSSYASQKNTLVQLTNENNKLMSVQEALTSALNTEITSLDKARASNKELLAIRNQLNLSTAEGQAELTKINAKLDENNAFIKDNVSAYEQQKIGIGNYEEAIRKVFPAGGDFISMITQFKDGLMAQKSAMMASTTATTASGKALQFLKIALISTGIGAIVVALGLLVKGFLSTQAGIDKVTAVTRPLQSIMQSLFGVIQNVATGIVDAFSNPKKAMQDIADFVKTNLINRFKAFGVILDGIINLDFKKVADGVMQAGTGVEGMTDKIKNASKETSDFLNEAIKKGQELDRLEKELRQVRISNRLEVGKLTEELKAQNLIAEDVNKSFAEREIATKRSIEVAKEINALKQKELDLEIAILENKQSRNDTSDEEKLQLAELIAKKNEANAQELELATTQTNKLNSIRKEAQAKAIETANKRKDAEIQAMNEELELFIQNQGIKKKSLEEELLFEADIADKRIAILKKEQEAGKITKTAFEAQKLAITNEFGQKQIDASIQTAQRELELYKRGIEQKIADDTFFSEEKLRIKIAEDTALAEKEMQFHQLRLEKGVINEQEYLDAINLVKENQKIKEEEALALQKEAEKERDLIDAENRRLLEEETYQTAFAQKIERLETEKQAELDNAEKTGANKKIIEAKYALQQSKLTADLENFKREQMLTTFQGFASLLGQSSVLGKAVAIYQAIINTKEGITASLKIGGFRGLLQAALIGAKGFSTVASMRGDSIPNIPTPKMAKGGIIGGQRHSSGGTKFFGEDGTTFEAEKGEFIGVLSRQATGKFLEFNNQFTNGALASSIRLKPKFQTGGVFSPRGNGQNVSLIADNTAQMIADKINSIKVVTVVDDVTDMQGIKSEIIDGADV